MTCPSGWILQGTYCQSPLTVKFVCVLGDASLTLLIFRLFFYFFLDNFAIKCRRPRRRFGFRRFRFSSIATDGSITINSD